MKKKVVKWAVAIIAIVATSCTMTLYVQKNNTDSSFDSKTSTENSADSATVSLQLPANLLKE